MASVVVTPADPINANDDVDLPPELKREPSLSETRPPAGSDPSSAAHVRHKPAVALLQAKHKQQLAKAKRREGKAERAAEQAIEAAQHLAAEKADVEALVHRQVEEKVIACYNQPMNVS